MPLKKSTGNMYPWVTHMHSHLAGECPHKCGYCYVQRNPHGVSPHWKGAPRLIEDELKVDYGSGKIIFIEHMGDLFAEEINDEWTKKIINHCWVYPENTYVLQSKNPSRAFWFYKTLLFPDNFMIGTTIETNRNYKDTKAPEPKLRWQGMLDFRDHGFDGKNFVTIEPIMNFDVDILVDWIITLSPQFVNIGADSKECNLPEPSPAKIKELIFRLQSNGIIIKKKSNLARLGFFGNTDNR